MYTDFITLFSYRQYVGSPVYYYFDRKTYKICDVASVPPESNYYKRYVPLLQIDEEAIQQSFIEQINDRHLIRKYKERNVCFEAFLQQYNLWERWWSYYRNKINLIAQQWCDEHSIKYKPQEF